MVTEALKNAFWAAVADCLQTFHGYERIQAVFRASELRARIESPPPGLSGDMIYHSEPYQVACDLADREVDLSENWPEYEAILAERFDSELVGIPQFPPVREQKRSTG